MSRRRHPTAREAARLHDLIDAGLDTRAIAAEMGVCRDTISAWRRLIGRSMRAPPLRNDPARQALLVELVAKGLPVHHICALAHVQSSDVRAERQRQKIPRCKLPGATPKLPDDELAALLRSGLSQAQIVRQTGVRVESRRFRAIRLKYGIERRT